YRQGGVGCDLLRHRLVEDVGLAEDREQRGVLRRREMERDCVARDRRSEAASGTPKPLALGFATTLYVAATSAGPNDEPSLNFTFWRMVSWMSLPPLANWKAVASHGWVPAAVGSSSSNSTRGSLTMLRVPMLDETELESYGLKSCEKVTPVVGSAMSGFPPVTVLFPCWHAVNKRAATPSRAVTGRQFMDQSPPLMHCTAQCAVDGDAAAGTETPDASSTFLTSFVSPSRVPPPGLRFRLPAARRG